MRLTDLVNLHYQKDTPVYFYDPKSTELEADGAYITRMAPPTRNNKNGGVYLPDISTQDYYDSCTTNTRILPGMQQNENYLRDKMILRRDQNFNDITLALFIILHEEGHWNHFLMQYHSKGLSGEDYLRDSDNVLDQLGIKEIREKVKNDPNYFNELQLVYM